MRQGKGRAFEGREQQGTEWWARAWPVPRQASGAARHWASWVGPPPVAREVGFWIQLRPRVSDASHHMPVGPPDDRRGHCRCPNVSSAG